MRLWPEGTWKNLKMELGEGSTGRHKPFILTLGRHEMPDCAWVQRVQWGLGVGEWGEKGQPAPATKPLGNKIPTHSAAVWPRSYRKGFSERQGGVAPDPAPRPLPSLGAWSLSVSHLALDGGRDQEGLYVGGCV